MPAETSSAKTLRQILADTAAIHGSKPALSMFGGETLNYSDLHESAETLAQWLAEQGIGFRDRVCILSESCPHWGVAYFAVTSLGAVAVPVLTDFHQDAIQHIIRHSEAKAVFVSEKLFAKLEFALFDPAPLFVNLETFQPFEAGISRVGLKSLKEAGLREFRKLREQAMRLANRAPREPEENDLAAIIYTSGTSGHSKGVMLTHRNLLADATAVRTLIDVRPDDCFLSILPLAHAYECTLGLILPVMHGAHVYYLDKPPTARALLPALQSVKPTAVLSVPLVIEKIYKVSILPKLTGSRLKKFLYSLPPARRLLNRLAGKKLLATFGGRLRVFAIGGAPLAPDVELFLREANFPYAIGYGLTETSPLSAGIGPEGTKPGSCGRPLLGLQLRIEAPDPATGIGEIMIKGPNVMQGYYKAPDLTKETLTEDGWLHTGDLGRMDKDGYVYIMGRSKNMILGPSGENIYPEEVESILLQAPMVLECLVYQSAGRLSARVHLDSPRIDEMFAGLSEEKALQNRAELLEQIRNSTNERVSSFAKIQKILEQADPFEKTATQKIKRYLYVDKA